jgi:hypothetical protein
MAKFIKCTTDSIKIESSGENFVNRAVNIDRVAAMAKSVHFGQPAITFYYDGGSFDWAYPNAAARDTQYEAIISDN